MGPGRRMGGRDHYRWLNGRNGLMMVYMMTFIESRDVRVVRIV